MGRLSESLRSAATAARTLTRRPVFAALSILLTALGVGAVTVIFAVVNATLLRPLPYRDPGALYALSVTLPVNRDSSADLALSFAELSRWRAESRLFTGVEGYTPAEMKLLGTGEPESLHGAIVSAGFFELLGWAPQEGKLFTRADEHPQNGVAVISHGLWQRRFGGDPKIIGRVINIDDEPRAIVAVMPDRFSMLFQHCDVWTPMLLNAERLVGGNRMVAGIGRLRAGGSAIQGKADLATIESALMQEQPDVYRFTSVKVVPLRESLFGPQRATLLVLLAAVLILVGVATVNVLSLTYADGLARQNATMTRLALGASRATIVKLRLTETVIISLAGAAIGLGAGRLGLLALAAVSPDAIAGFGAITVDPIVAAVALVLALGAGLAAAFPAALKEARTGFAGFAGTAMKSIGGKADRRNRDWLLGAQVALATVLLIGAALLARNVQSLLRRPMGFEAPGVTVVELTFSRTTYPTKEQRAAYAQQLIAALHAVPGVEAVATYQSRFVLNETMMTGFEIDGQPADPGVQQAADVRHTTPEILSALGIRLLQGRGFLETDRMDSPPVALVNAAFAKHYWGNANVLGKRIRRGGNAANPWMEVVGVTDDVMDAGVGVKSGPALYVSYLQQNTPTARPTLIIRARGGAASLFPAIRRAIWSVDPAQTIDSMTQLEELLLRSAAQPRFAALIAVLFAGSALLLVLCGIYAVTLYAVVRRTKELGLRSALGARPMSLVRATMWQSVRPVLFGTVVGAAAAIPAGRAMRKVLTEGMSGADAPVLALVLVGVVISAALAAFLPARRALAIPPSLAMRE